VHAINGDQEILHVTDLETHLGSHKQVLIRISDIRHIEILNESEQNSSDLFLERKEIST
jgi:hypothetical protein